MTTILDRAALDLFFNNWVAYGAVYWKRVDCSKSRLEDADSQKLVVLLGHVDLRPLGGLQGVDKIGR